MRELAEFFWIYISLSFGIGLLTGVLTWSRQDRKEWGRGWLVWGVIAFAFGVIVAWQKWLPGRNGMYLELALLFFAAFVIGCWIGGLLRGIFAPAKHHAEHSDGQSDRSTPAGAQTVLPKRVVEGEVETSRNG